MLATSEQNTASKSLKDYSDMELISAVLETGDNEYFGEIYDRYSDKVYGKCILMVKDLTLAQDLTQDIFVKAFTKLNTFQVKSSFGTWPYQVTYTHCMDYIRKNKNVLIIEVLILIAGAIAYGHAARGIMKNMLSSFYSRKNFYEGQKIRIGELSGTILGIDKISVTIKTEDSKVIIPSSQLLENKVEVLND